jgi:hypothetical protein
MVYTDTEIQNNFCDFTDVKFSSASPREQIGSFKSTELSLHPKHDSQYRDLRHLHLELSLHSLTAALHPQFQSGVKVYIYMYIDMFI